MASTLGDNAGIKGRTDRRPEIDSGHRATGARGSKSVTRIAERKAWEMEALLEPRGNKAEDARMPVLSCHDDHWPLSLAAQGGFGFRGGVVNNPHFDGLALTVEALEFEGECTRLATVSAQQQSQGDIRLADATGCVEPRSQHETERIGIRPSRQPGNIGKRGKSDIFAPRHDFEALHHIGSIETNQRNNVANRGECHQLEPLQQIRLRAPALIPALATKQSAGGGNQDHRDAGCAQIAGTRYVITTVGIDDGQGRRQRLARLMMVDDDNVQAEFSRLGQWVMRHHTAVKGQKQAGAPLAQAPDGRFAGAIALADAIGDVSLGIGAN